MENIKGTTAGSDKHDSGHLIFEEFVPPSAWTEESAAHHLLVDLPGFKRKELKLQVEDQSHIIVSGERQVKDNKYMRFEQKFLLPGNSDIGKITGKIEGEILYVTVPKIVAVDNKPPKYESHTGGEEKHMSTNPKPSRSTRISKENTKVHEFDDGRSHKDDEKLAGEDEVFHEANGDSWRQRGELLANAIIKSELLETAVIKLMKNRGIVITAVLAISLGVFVSQNFHSNRE